MDSLNLAAMPVEVIQNICVSVSCNELRLSCKFLYQSTLYSFAKQCGDRLAYASFTPSKTGLSLLRQISAVEELRDRMCALTISSHHLYTVGEGMRMTQSDWIEKELPRLLKEQEEFQATNEDFRMLVDIFTNLRIAKRLFSINLGSHPDYSPDISYFDLPGLVDRDSGLSSSESYKILSDAHPTSRSYLMPLHAISRGGLEGVDINLALRGQWHEEPTAFNEDALANKTWKQLFLPGYNTIGLVLLEDYALGQHHPPTEWFCELLKSASGIQTLELLGHLPDIYSDGWCPNCLSLSRAFTATIYPKLCKLVLHRIVIQKPRLGRFLKAHRETLLHVELVAIKLIEGTWRKIFPLFLTMDALFRLRLIWLYQKMDDRPMKYWADMSNMVDMVEGHENIEAYVPELTSSFDISQRVDGFSALYLPLVAGRVIDLRTDEDREWW